MYSNKPVLVAKDVNVFMTANSSQGNQDSWPRGAHGRQQTATATSLKEAQPFKDPGSMGFSDLSDFEAFVPKHLNSLLDYFFKALFILFLLESYLWRGGETERERKKKQWSQDFCYLNVSKKAMESVWGHIRRQPWTSPIDKVFILKGKQMLPITEPCTTCCWTLPTVKQQMMLKDERVNSSSCL